MTDKQEQLQATAAKLGIGGYRRHVFLCTGPTCCTPEVGQAAFHVRAVEDRSASAHRPA